MDLSYIFSLVKQLSFGLQYTVELFFITIIVSIPLGMLFAFARNSRIAVLRGILSGYIWIMRGTPLLLQLFFFYFGLPFVPVVGQFLTMQRFPAACVAFCFNYAAYFCEIFRGGLLSVDKGQHEAAKVLGFSKWQTSFHIVIPQMLRVSLPAVTNESITLVKDTALITSLGITEILFYTTAAVERDVNISAYIIAAVFYLLFTLLLTKLFKYLEKRLAF